jgi:hypothetical protein
MHGRADMPVRKALEPSSGRIWLGAVLAAGGVTIFGAILFIADDRSTFSEWLFFRLGLALMALISMVGQVMAILGLEMICRGLASQRDAA